MNNVVIPPCVDVAALRAAGVAWAARPVPDRLSVVRRARVLMARGAETLAATVTRPVADTLVAEVLPLLEAARFLEREAEGLMRTRPARGRRPLWLLGVRSRIARRPLGAVLVLAPGNYPLFLPGTQALQALVAGNAVAWKPAPGGEAAAVGVAGALAEAGLPEGVLQVLGVEDGPAAVAAGFDHIVLTGSAETGAAVLSAAAPLLTPCTMELSGCDAVFVLPGADLKLVARCLVYGLRLNGGGTCIAPRRVFVPRAAAADLEGRLAALLPRLPEAAVPQGIAARLAGLVDAAVGEGARLVGEPGNRVALQGAGGASMVRPVVLAAATAEMALLQQDVFAPWLALVAVEQIEEALVQDARCPYALGASVFGPAGEARAFADRLRPGSICINDVIVPTADPRLAFGGGGRSGFGRTRGVEGLLGMTASVAISERRGWFRPHLSPPGPKDAGRFAGMVRWLHGRGGQAAPP